jgi:hypothetical protein
LLLETERLFMGVMMQLRVQLLTSVVAAGVFAASGVHARAVDALTFPNGPASGIAFTMDGGPGWSFVPTTNLTVTRVGYLDLAATGGDPSAVVTIWAGTNTVIASYTGITDLSAQYGDLVFATISPLGLTAGQAYSITVNTPPLAGSTWFGALHDNEGAVQYDPFVVAPELGQYRAWQLNQDGTFGPPPSDPSLYQQLMWLGPTFTYQVGSPPPVLTIALPTSNSVLLSWPTNAVGFVLQSSLAVTGTYANVTSSPSVVGANYTTTLPRTNAASLFRLRKWSVVRSQ